MDSHQRARRAFELFEAALDIPVAGRTAFLDSACGNDAELRRQVEDLLTADADFETHAPLPSVFGQPGLGSLIGERIGPYEIVEEIGQGGMGTVYRARREDINKEVALKLIRDGRLASPAQLQRFLLERRVLAQLEHPNIARLLDAGITETGLPYFAMEFVEGDSITDYCDARRLTVNQRLELFRDVCRAVQYAHRNLVVHRDLKPSNILVDASGTVKLLDFGIAKLMETDANEPHPVTVTGLRMMTPEYASPEQVRGRPVTTSSDVYSLGIILYELLTGHRPYRFETRSLQEVERVVCEALPRRPSTVISSNRTASGSKGADIDLTPDDVAQARSIPVDRLRRRLGGDLDNIVLMALRKEPTRRYRSADQLLDDIDRHLANLPVVARPDTLGYRVQKFIRRHRVGMALAAGVFILIIGFVLRERALRTEAEQARDAARTEAAKAERVAGFLVDLFEVSDPGQARGETITAREVLDRGAEQVEIGLAEEAEVQAMLMAVLGRVYMKLGLYDASDPLLGGALKRRETLLGSEHLDVAESLGELALLRFNQGRFVAAESLSTMALNLQRAMLGPEHLDVAESLNTLSMALNRKGAYALAESLATDALALRRQQLKPGHPDIAESLTNLARIKTYNGDLPGAKPLYQEALEIRRALLGPDHPDAVETLMQLANVTAQTGDIDTGEAYYREALELQRKLYGEEHPQIAVTLNFLGVLMMRKQDIEAAEALHREALAMREKLLGSEHPDVAVSLFNLARLADRKGNLQEAEALYRRVLALERKLLGDSHRHVLYDLHDLALFLHRRKKDPGEAEQWMRQAVELGMNQLDETDAYRAELHADLGRILLDNAAFEEAETYFRQALVGYESSADADSSDMAETEGLLGESLIRLGRYADAEPLLIQSLNQLTQTADPDDDRTGAARQRLVALYEAWGRPEKADPYRTP